MDYITVSTEAQPIVYLLHFTRPLGNEKHTALHYIGFSSHIEERLQAHRTGASQAKIMQALFQRGISFKLARLWEGGRELERALKASKKYARLCPICQQEAIAKRLGLAIVAIDHSLFQAD